MTITESERKEIYNQMSKNEQFIVKCHNRIRKQLQTKQHRHRMQHVLHSATQTFIIVLHTMLYTGGQVTTRTTPVM